MKVVTRDEFDSYIRKFQAGELSMGRDVGRTHGIISYSRRGKTVAVERWAISSGTRYFTYEVAK
jgi:hypothetical protein